MTGAMGDGAPPAQAPLDVQTFTVGPLQENAYLVVDRERGEAVFIDPGDEAERLAEALAATGATLRAIWCTHGHVDHVGAIAPLVRRFGVPVALHPADRPLYDRAAAIGVSYGLRLETPPPPSLDLAEGDVLHVGAHAFSVVHLPGHAPGHVWFVGDGVAFGGDVLFAGSIGRTDLPLCDPRAMHASLQRVAAMDPSLRVLPGHGPATTIGRERETNPFLQGLARPIGA